MRSKWLIIKRQYHCEVLSEKTRNNTSIGPYMVAFDQWVGNFTIKLKAHFFRLDFLNKLIGIIEETTDSQLLSRTTVTDQINASNNTNYYLFAHAMHVHSDRMMTMRLRLCSNLCIHWRLAFRLRCAARNRNPIKNVFEEKNNMRARFQHHSTIFSFAASVIKSVIIESNQFVCVERSAKH